MLTDTREMKVDRVKLKKKTKTVLVAEGNAARLILFSVHLKRGGSKRLENVSVQRFQPVNRNIIIHRRGDRAIGKRTGTYWRWRGAGERSSNRSTHVGVVETSIAS